MRQLPDSEIRFLIKLGLQRLPRSILKDLGGAADKREVALNTATDIVAQRFKGREILAPDPIRNHG